MIYQWEISDPKDDKQKTSAIYLLSDNAFKNEAPQHLVDEALKRYADEYRIKFEGAEKEKSKRVTADSLD